MQYTIKKIGVWSAFKFGIVFGIIFGFFHSFATGMTARWAIAGLSEWLDSWLAISVPIMGDLALVDALMLGDFAEMLQKLDEGSLFMVVGITLAFTMFGGFIVGLLTVLIALIYNIVAAFSGGLEVQADTMGGVPQTTVSNPITIPTRSPKRTTAVPSTVPPPAQPQTSAWLVSKNERHPILPDGVLIGSAPDNQLCLSGLSPHHAQIQMEGGRYILHDLSGGQSWVNGRLLSAPNMLKDGFRVRLGNQEFVFQGG